VWPNKNTCPLDFQLKKTEITKGETQVRTNGGINANCVETQMQSVHAEWHKPTTNSGKFFDKWEKLSGYNKHICGIRKEAQIVIHNYSSISFIACYMFWLSEKTSSGN